MAYKAADRVLGQRLPPERFQHPVKRSRDIRGRVGKGAVEIEGDGAKGEGGHKRAAVAPAYGNRKISVRWAPS
jgi:hypothetical protein